MRIFFVAVVLFYSLIAHSNEEKDKNEVWVNGSSFYQSIPHKKKSTIYFETWSPYIQRMLEDEDYFVAMQLDTSFDPLPADREKLPNLTSLAAIQSEDLLNDYFTFLEHYGRSQGFNYLILPNEANLNNFERRVLELASLKSPYYFIEKEYLSYSIPEVKKDFDAEKLGHPTIWIVNQDDNLSKIQRWSSKYLSDDQVDFFASLRESREQMYFPTFELPEHLKTDLFKEAVIAIDGNQVLPLTDQTIVYLGNDLSLHNWLSQYVNVLSYRKNGIRTIVDLRNEDLEVLENDIVLAEEYQAGVNASAQVIIPISLENESFFLSKMLFGSMAINGMHPEGRIIHDHRFIGHSNPQYEKMNEEYLNAIDSMAAHAIKNYATPGMQLSIIKNGNFVLEKNYGFQTYDSLKAVNDETLYDVASLTKVLATLPAIALLIDREKLALDDSVSQYLPEFSGSNKSGLTIRQLLAHNGGLRSYIPFWSMMMGGDRLDPFYYKTPEDEALDRRTFGFEPDPILLDTLKSFLIRSELIKNPGTYNYSDLGFMVLHLVVEAIAGMPFDEFVDSEFYHSMGLEHTMFNPLSKGIDIARIAPTEYDHRYRNYQVWGEVHDRNALVFGGVAGHAGLFSTASDVSKIMGMLLNGGYYGGKRYLSEEVLKQFNIRYFEKNRRGLGWDKKDGMRDSASKYASDSSYGHTGFTGTMVWADPEQEIIFVFLSNRIYPDAENWRLGQYNTRTLMHDAVYMSINSGD